jgi:hypothetical protein
MEVDLYPYGGGPVPIWRPVDSKNLWVEVHMGTGPIGFLMDTHKIQSCGSFFLIRKVCGISTEGQ